MRLTDKIRFDEFHALIEKDIAGLVARFDFASGADTLGYKTQASAVYSSNIEGNSVDLNSFMNYNLSKSAFKPQKEVQEIEDLVAAKLFRKWILARV